MGMDVFKRIHPEAKIIVAEAVWRYSHHVLAGLRDNQGPILTLANWSGEWSGLVGMLNLNASLTKMGVKFSTIWSIDFTDNFFLNGIHQWIDEGRITHDTSHILDFDQRRLPSVESELGISLAKELMQSKAIRGIFDEGCMGMYNAIIDDEQLNKLGVYKERLSQSALFVAIREVTDKEAQSVRGWLDERVMTFVTGTDAETELTDQQLLEQCKMYIAAVRIAAKFGCDTIGIQYQQGLKDLVPASDLTEGLLNNPDRPPVFDPMTGNELYRGKLCPTSTRWMSAPGSTLLLLTGSG